MGYDEAQVRRVVRDSTDPAVRPTALQIEELAVMTYDSDALVVMDRMLRRRLDPEAYVATEAEHTLLTLRSCLCAASEKFVAYVKHDIQPLVIQFHSKTTTKNIQGVQRVARSLLNILRDEEALAKERSSYRHRRTDITKRNNKEGQDARDRKAKSSPQTVTETLPMTPPDTPKPSLPRSQDNPVSKAPEPSSPEISPSSRKITGLPTPPTDIQAPLYPINEELVNLEHKVRIATSNTPPPITTKQMDEVVDMTYDPDKLPVLMNILDTRLAALKSQQTYHHLVKTLTLIHHCLFQASDEFVELCRHRREVFETLSNLRCPNSVVLSRAGAVLDRLRDEQRLGKERQSRKVLGKLRRSSTLSDRSKESKTVPMSPPLVPLSRPRSLEDENALVEKIGDCPADFGGFSDVWKATLTFDHGVTHTLVALKVLRVIGTTKDNSPERLLKRLQREVNVWKLLDHESVANYHGVVYHSNKPAIVSSWYVNGCADVYLRDHPEVNPLKTLWEIALGVEYLHQNGIVHGDLKGKNVMIDEVGHAKLIDFGLSRLLGPFTGPSGLTTSNVALSLRWCAPELVIDSDSQRTKASDLYAFGSTALQLLTGEEPYATLKEVAIIMAVVNGESPRSSSGSIRYKLRHTDQIWGLLDSCWNEASLRPTISNVKEQIRILYP